MSKPLVASVDAGLAGLGLAIRTFAGVGMCVAVLGAMFIPLFGGSASSNLLMWLWVVTALARTALHLVVGDHAVRRSPGVERAALTYLIGAVIHTGIGLAALAQFGAINGEAMMFILGFAVVSLGWPLSVYFITRRPALRAAFAAAETFDTSIVPADRGINSAAVLMVAFASSTLALPVMLLGTLLSQVGPPGLDYYLLLVTALLFLARGIYAFTLGIRTHNGRIGPADFRKGLRTYRTLAIITTIALIITFLSMPMVRHALGDKTAFAFISLGAIVVATLVWPYVLGRFASQLDQEDATEESEPPVTTASDAGAVTLGQYMLYFGWFSVGIVVASLAIMMVGGRSARMLGMDDEVAMSTLEVLVSLGTIGTYVAIGLVLLSIRRIQTLLLPTVVVWMVLMVSSQVLTFVGDGELVNASAIDVVVGILTTALPAAGLLSLIVPILKRRTAAP